MSETSPGLPPVCLNIPVRVGGGRRWGEHLNGGLSVEETSPLTNARHQIIEWQEEREAAGNVLGFSAFAVGIIGLGIFVVSKFVQHETTGPTSWDIGSWAAFALAACGFLLAEIYCAHLWKRIDRRTEDLATTVEPLMDRLIEVNRFDDQLHSLAEELNGIRTRTGEIPTPEVQAAFLDALKALASFADQTSHRPDLDLARVASARHLYDDPAVKAIADDQKAATATKTATYIAARAAVEHFTKTAEDAETLRIAHARIDTP